MPHFIKSPNLPSGQVSIVAIGEDYAKEISLALMSFDIQTLTCPNNPLVDERLRSHIDLSAFHIGENRFIISNSISQSKFADELKCMGANIFVSDTKFMSNYPLDSALCALSVGDILFHNLKYSDNLLKDNGWCKKLHVNQGYTKCAVCPIIETAAITADAGLAKIMKNEGFDVLEISAKGIELKGFNDGFIGGSAFKIAPDKLAFTGTICNHPDKTAIEEFLKLYGISPVYLTDKPIFDVGSVIPISEF